VILCVDIGNVDQNRARPEASSGASHCRPRRAQIARVIARAATGRVEQAAIASVRPASTGGRRRDPARAGFALLVSHRSGPLVVGTRRPRVGIDGCAAGAAIERGKRHRD
jgi:hypothetical protein